MKPMATKKQYFLLIYTPYFLVIANACLLAYAVYIYATIWAIVQLALSIWWLWRFNSIRKYWANVMELDNLFKEADYRIKTGAPICEIKEMIDKRVKRL